MTRPAVSDLVRSEFLAVTTLRLWWALGLAALLAGALAAVVPVQAVTGPAAAQPASAVSSPSPPLELLLATGAACAAAALFGAVHAGSGFRYTAAATAFLTSRGRDRAIAAALAAVAVVAFGYGVVVDIAVVPLLVVGPAAAPLDAPTAAALATGPVVAMLWALGGAGAALLTPSPATAAVGVAAWCVLGEGMTRAVLDGLGLGALGTRLPAAATVDALSGRGGTAAPLLCLLFWAALVGGAGWWSARRRDLV